MIHKKLVDLIRAEQKATLGKDRHGWATGKFKEIRELPADKRGDVGKHYVASLLKRLGRQARVDSNHKHWDIVVLNGKKDIEMTIEVKTATLGYGDNIFQHENLKKNRACDGIIFLDIAPNDIYISAYCKQNFDWNKAHRRRTGKQYKFDLNLNSLKSSGKQIKTIADFKRCYENLLAEVTYFKTDEKGKYTI